MANFFKDPWASIGGRKVEKQIDRSAQDFYNVARWATPVMALGTWIYQTQKTEKHRMADYQAQTAAQNRELAEYMANINRQRADWSIFDQIVRSRRLANIRGRQSQGILTSPLGLGAGTEGKKLLLGQ